MTPRIVKDSPGRPISGTEPKEVTVKFRIEPTLRDELRFTCRIIGIPVAEGIRRGIMMFIRSVQKDYR